MSIIQKLVAAAVAAFAVCSNAREITSVKIVQESGIAKAKVSLAAGETGDNHVLYLAYGSRNCGETLHAWANGGGVMPCLEVADGATSVSVELSGNAAKAAYHKAFLVKKTAVPAYESDKYKLIDALRKDNAYVWFVTDWFCSGNEKIAIECDNIAQGYSLFGATSQQSENETYPNVMHMFRSVYSNKNYLWFNNLSTDFKTIYSHRIDSFESVASMRTKVVFDAFSKKYEISTNGILAAEGSIEQSLTDGSGFNSTYPLSIFACSTNSAGTPVKGCVQGGGLLHRFSIVTNNSAYARFYIPVTYTTYTKEGKTYTRGRLWDVVENKYLDYMNANGYQQSQLFFAHDGSFNQYRELDFHAVVPVELQAKYETVVSSRNADRQIREVSVERRSVTVSLTPGLSGGNDILYIAWGDSDKGDTLAAWGDNVYCAGEVADDATSVSVALPRGIYPNHFRAFLLERSDIDCDGFVEYLLSTGKSYIKSDWFVEKGDKFSMCFSLGSVDSDQRLFGGHDGQPDTTCVELYLGNSTYRHAIWKDEGIDFDSSKVPTDVIPLYASEVTELYYDSANSEFSVSYIGQGESYNYQFSEGTATAKSGTEMFIFSSSRVNWESRRMKAGAKFYSMTISNMVDSVATLARHYIPAKKVVDGVAVYGVWDGVGNKFLTPPVAFSSKTFEGAEFDSVPFSGASMPEDLKRRYLTVVDSASAYRKEAGLHITIR